MSAKPNDPVLVEALIKHLEKNYISMGPLLMTLAMLLALASSIPGPLRLNSAIVSAAVSIGVIGGYLEFHSLLVVMRVKDLVLGVEPSLLRYVGKAALLTGLYYTVIGSLLIASTFKDAVEYATEKPIEDLFCSRFYKSVMIVASLGAWLMPLQSCISRALAGFLASPKHVFMEELPEGLGPQTDYW